MRSCRISAWPRCSRRRGHPRIPPNRILSPQWSGSPFVLIDAAAGDHPPSANRTHKSVRKYCRPLCGVRQRRSESQANFVRWPRALRDRQSLETVAIGRGTESPLQPSSGESANYRSWTAVPGRPDLVVSALASPSDWKLALRSATGASIFNRSRVDRASRSRRVRSRSFFR
jgi:hypothetical protein